MTTPQPRIRQSVAACASRRRARHTRFSADALQTRGQCRREEHVLSRVIGFQGRGDCVLNRTVRAETWRDSKRCRISRISSGLKTRRDWMVDRIGRDSR